MLQDEVLLFLISLPAGYEDPGYFSKVFKKNMGFTKSIPEKYRSGIIRKILPVITIINRDYKILVCYYRNNCHYKKGGRQNGKFERNC